MVMNQDFPIKVLLLDNHTELLKRNLSINEDEWGIDWFDDAVYTPEDRPYYHYDFLTIMTEEKRDVYFHLYHPLHEWLVKNNIPYDISEQEDSNWNIAFKTIADALIFKLTWF